MKTMNFPPKRSAGIGLIEVLIATVVVAVGLMAVASLQGDLISGSRTSKTRTEAKALADTKIEQLRDTIEQTGAAGYTALASSAANESITGVNETFSRGWTVTDLTNPSRKQISVRVGWTGDQVLVQSIIAYDAVGNSALVAKGADDAGVPISGPSTNAESSDEITETIDIPSATPGSIYTDANGKTYIVQSTGTKAIGADGCSGLGLTAFENGLLTRRVNHDGVSGDEAIELYELATISGVEYCIPRIRYNGGVIIPVRGIVHSGATTAGILLDVNLFTFNASETGAFCVFNPQAGAKSAPYVCYVGGNCQGFTGTTSTAVTDCPGSISAAKVGPGGWRGKVGLLGVASTSPSGGKNVCFAEELAGSPATLDTARNYYARNSGLNEGINKPYSCHDFLIINGQNTEAQVHSECVAQANAIGGFTLASKNIQRNISGANVFDPTIDTSFCVGAAGTDYVITGNITGASASPTVTVSDGTTPVNCSATTSTYTCNITTSANSVTISGVYNSQPVSCNVSLSSATPSATGCPLAFTALPVYTITGHISATTASAANAVSLAVIDGGNTINCTNNQNYTSGYNTYTCLISTLSTTGITINAQAATGYAVTPATYNVPTLSGATSTVVVPSTANDFVASAVPSYTIKGDITLGSNISGSLTVTDAVLLGNCGTAANGDGLVAPSGGWRKSKTGSYQCTLYQSSTNSFSLAISPTNNAGVNYTLSATPATGVTSSAGQLLIDLSNISSNQTYDITIN
jgi:hypothetical protein